MPAACRAMISRSKATDSGSTSARSRGLTAAGARITSYMPPHVHVAPNTTDEDEETPAIPTSGKRTRVTALLEGILMLALCTACSCCSAACSYDGPKPSSEAHAPSSAYCCSTLVASRRSGPEGMRLPAVAFAAPRSIHEGTPSHVTLPTRRGDSTSPNLAARSAAPSFHGAHASTVRVHRMRVE